MLLREEDESRGLREEEDAMRVGVAGFVFTAADLFLREGVVDVVVADDLRLDEGGLLDDMPS